jgi:hypothetical protein
MQINRLTGSREAEMRKMRQKRANMGLPVAFTGEESDDTAIASTTLTAYGAGQAGCAGGPG